MRGTQSATQEAAVLVAILGAFIHAHAGQLELPRRGDERLLPQELLAKLRVVDDGESRERAHPAPPAHSVLAKLDLAKVAQAERDEPNECEECHGEDEDEQAEEVGARALVLRPRPLLLVVEQALAAREAAATARHDGKFRARGGRCGCGSSLGGLAWLQAAGLHKKTNPGSRRSPFARNSMRTCPSQARRIVEWAFQANRSFPRVCPGCKTMLAVALFGVAAAARGALLPTPKAGITQRTVRAPRAPLPRMDEGGLDGMGEEVGDGERGEIDDFRAQLLRQFGGVDAPAATIDPETRPAIGLADTLAAGQVLLAHPQRFCSRNPFARPVRDLGRFGLQGPVSDEGLEPDVVAQMLPVLLLLEHSSAGSLGLLLERRTGALMGDISMEDYGCVAISPLWLGGTARQNSLYAVHTYDDVVGSTPIRDGLRLGGWADARPRVADSSLAEGRFKFFLGATEWSAGQLEQEMQAGAWIALDCAPDLVVKDRVIGWQPGRPKPVWTELLGLVGPELNSVMKMVYQNGPE